jgi:pimeloyl-ACP methyl ester carboxylesterase/predicted glycosyltransferase
MYAENNGVKIWYEVHGHGEPTLFIIPGFQIEHSEQYKRTFVPFLSRHMRVVTVDLRGSGKSDQPEGGHDLETYAEDIHAVVQAAGLDCFAMAGASCGVSTIITYHANHPSRVSHLILLNGYASMVRTEDYPLGVPEEALRGSLQRWQKQPEDMLKWFIDVVCSENYSLRNKELIWQWAHESSPNILARGYSCSILSNVDGYLNNIDLPVLILHAQKDKIVFPGASDHLHDKISGSTLIHIPEAGHAFIRTWPQVGRHILNFLKPEMRTDSQSGKQGEHPKILWISSPVGLGHVKRDLAIAAEMRKKRPHLTIHWLAADPVRSHLEAVGEQVHPLSNALWNESSHFESHATDHTLDVMEALWEMDKLMNNNFMVFDDAVREDGYDLVVGDESWDVVHYLHYNPTLKTAPFVFITDFVGASNVSNDQTRQAHVYDFNGIWVEMRQRHPEASDLSIYVGELENLPDRPFGEGLSNIRQWTQEHFKFSGYILPFDPADYSNRQALRAQLGFSPEDKILLVAVGGTAVGRPLIKKCLEAQPGLKETIPGIRTIVLCGPRIDPGSFGRLEEVEFQSFIPDPIKHYAACDLAVIQGGLSTTMELTALGRPFLYFPLKDHFEQQHDVFSRLKGYKAGVRMDFDDTNPSTLVEAIVANIGKPVDYRPVHTDGAQKAAAMILELISKGET